MSWGWRAVEGRMKMALRKWEISRENSIVMRGPGRAEGYVGTWWGRGVFVSCYGGGEEFRERERYVGRICMRLADDVSIKLIPVTFKSA